MRVRLVAWGLGACRSRPRSEGALHHDLECELRMHGARLAVDAAAGELQQPALHPKARSGRSPTGARPAGRSPTGGSPAGGTPRGGALRGGAPPRGSRGASCHGGSIASGGGDFAPRASRRDRSGRRRLHTTRVLRVPAARRRAIGGRLRRGGSTHDRADAERGATSAPRPSRGAEQGGTAGVTGGLPASPVGAFEDTELRAAAEAAAKRLKVARARAKKKARKDSLAGVLQGVFAPFAFAIYLLTSSD